MRKKTPMLLWEIMILKNRTLIILKIPKLMNLMLIHPCILLIFLRSMIIERYWLDSHSMPTREWNIVPHNPYRPAEWDLLREFVNISSTISSWLTGCENNPLWNIVTFIALETFNCLIHFYEAMLHRGCPLSLSPFFLNMWVGSYNHCFYFFGLDPAIHTLPSPSMDHLTTAARVADTACRLRSSRPAIFLKMLKVRLSNCFAAFDTNMSTVGFWDGR